jgi:hypothetical protein
MRLRIAVRPRIRGPAQRVRVGSEVPSPQPAIGLLGFQRQNLLFKIT